MTNYVHSFEIYLLHFFLPMFSASLSRCVKLFIYVSLFLLIYLSFHSSLRLSLDLVCDIYIDLCSFSLKNSHPDASVLVRIVACQLCFILVSYLPTSNISCSAWYIFCFAFVYIMRRARQRFIYWKAHHHV